MLAGELASLFRRVVDNDARLKAAGIPTDLAEARARSVPANFYTPSGGPVSRLVAITLPALDGRSQPAIWSGRRA